MKQFLISKFPLLGKYKRYFKALFNHFTSTKNTYSQHQEDIIFKDFFKKNGIDINKSLYIDIGSNHPSDISNTYLLYRHGYRGILIDANKELCDLCKKFRPNDIVMNIGASNIAGMMDFFISKTPVLSSFDTSNTHHNRQFYKKYKVPVLRIDDAIKSIEFNYISLLSIDVEGWNFKSLQGCEGFLNKTLLICIEYDEIGDKDLYSKFLKDYNFVKIYDNNCNAFYENKNIINELKMVSFR
jgi:FkbM family methyltransferase